MTTPHALAQSADTTVLLAEQAHQITLDINSKREEIAGQAELVARLKRQHKDELEKLNEMRAAEKNLIEDLIRVQNGQFIERLPFEPKPPKPGDTLKFIDTITTAELLANEFEPDTIQALCDGGITNGQELRLWLAKPNAEAKKIKGVSAPMRRRLDTYIVNRIARGSQAETPATTEPTPAELADAQQIVADGIAEMQDRSKPPAGDQPGDLPADTGIRLAPEPAAQEPAAADSEQDTAPETPAVRAARNELDDSLDARLATASAAKTAANRQILLMGMLKPGDKIPQQMDLRELQGLRDRIDKLTRREVVRVLADATPAETPKARRGGKDQTR